MAALVTLEQAKDQLNVTSTDKDALIQRKIETASAIILDYLKDRANISLPARLRMLVGDRTKILAVELVAGLHEGIDLIKI